VLPTTMVERGFGAGRDQEDEEAPIQKRNVQELFMEDM